MPCGSPSRSTARTPRSKRRVSIRPSRSGTSVSPLPSSTSRSSTQPARVTSSTRIFCASRISTPRLTARCRARALSFRVRPAWTPGGRNSTASCARRSSTRPLSRRSPTCSWRSTAHRVPLRPRLRFGGARRARPGRATFRWEDRRPEGRNQLPGVRSERLPRRRAAHRRGVHAGGFEPQLVDAHDAGGRATDFAGLHAAALRGPAQLRRARAGRCSSRTAHLDCTAPLPH